MKTYAVPDNQAISDLIATIPGINFSASCGGKGTCGKCRVRIVEGKVSPVSKSETKFLTQDELAKGFRLACMTTAVKDVVIELPIDTASMQIAADIIESIDDLDPLFRSESVQLEVPDLEDQRADINRVLDKIKDNRERNYPLELLSSLPAIIRESDFDLQIIYDAFDILNIRKNDAFGACFGIAVDIGTTTVVAYLINIQDGTVTDLVSSMNEQGVFGADVISRINHAKQEKEGLSHLHSKITGQLNGMIDKLAKKNSLSRDDIYGIVFAGNTTMVHLLANLPPENIAEAPFIPVTTDPIVCPARDIGIEIFARGKVYILPSIAAYVGADIVAGILASGMTEKDELALLIDIGTNGEIALGNSEHIVSCSVAAGPAFEGAEIRFGIGGVAGAIDTFSINDGKAVYTTIMDKKPIGICGSGIVDILAELLKAGLVDDTGRFVDDDEIEKGHPLAENLMEFEGFRSYKISDSIYFTQKDIREIQNAKAAVAAGIKTLITAKGKDVTDVQKVYLAGGFGSYINHKSAVAIGLLPKEIEDKVEAIGNSAGKGAILSLLSRKHYDMCMKIKGMVDYIELSSSKEFNDEYINNMYLPKF
jgi:uncharacterized 2Fe-2S/4Fe-4S cluster protein (DUF4445 family)